MSGNTTQLRTWLGRHRAGDDSARSELVAYSCDRLRVLASRMLRRYPRLGRWEQTDDVVQLATMRLHDSLASVKPVSLEHFLSLAATQIRRTLIDLGRHHFGPLGDAANHHTDEPGKTGYRLDNQSSDEPDSIEDWTRFHEAIDGLPDDEKSVFDLLWYEGLQQAEAAELLGVSVRTVKRRWRSAKILLQELVTDDET